MLDYMVLYQSETGNTKKLATSIFAALPGMAKDLRSIDELNGLPDAATYFVGFCVHRGTCSLEVGNLLSSISGKNVALFGTCGAGNVDNYYKNIENSARIWSGQDACADSPEIRVHVKWRSGSRSPSEASAVKF